MLPDSYLDADNRCVLPLCPKRGRLGLAFDVFGQPTIRLAITELAARNLRSCLDDYISSFAGNQSPGSLLSPSNPVSIPSEGVNT